MFHAPSREIVDDPGSGNADQDCVSRDTRMRRRAQLPKRLQMERFRNQIFESRADVCQG
jgi:hypothetical protein